MSSDQQVAFDNWQDAAEQLEKQQQIQKQEAANQPEETKEQVTDALNQQKKTEKQVPIDPKELLKSKIANYSKMTQEEFEQTIGEVAQTNKLSGKKIGNPVLKSDKDFSNYAKILAKRFDNIVQNEDATIEQQKMALFFEELTIYMYKNIEWKNLHDVQAKLKVLKKERKLDEDKRKKQKQKQERLKKTQGDDESKSQSIKAQQKKQEDLFGGVTNVTSKQEQEERKNKIIVQNTKKEQKQEEQDDDDFM